MRRQRPRRQSGDAAPSLAAALGVLLHCNSDFVAGHEMHATLCALLSTNRATRQAMTQWLTEQLTTDITRRHEAHAIPVRETGNRAPSVRALLLLLQFRYTTRVLIPVPREHHALPREHRDRLMRDHDGVKRVVRGCRVPLYAMFTEETAWGVYVAQRIPRGEYVGEYTGELISSAEARRRHAHEYDRATLNYILALREQTRDAASIVRTNVDATRCGSFARFFNHSCEPTLRVEALRVDSFVPRLVFFTQRDVERDEQLTFDYGCQATSAASPEDARDRGDGVACRCRAASCRGRMPFDASL
jgi:hypothetical protein